MFFNGSNPSGHALTVIINSLVNSIYIRVAFLRIFGNLDAFNRMVRLMTYGDDNVVSVHRDIQREFNFTTVRKALAIDGIIITTAQKSIEDIDFVPKEEISFLKRSWRPLEVNGETIYLAPLEPQSISNMLILQKRDNLQDEDRCVSVLLASALEAFHHGEAFYNKHVADCEECVREFKLQEWLMAKTEGRGFDTFANRLVGRLSNRSRKTMEDEACQRA
jgi:hypothetical protein